MYFYEGGGSIFMDYKIMRDEAYRKIGQAMGETDPEKATSLGYQSINEQFEPDMSTEVAMQVARSIVATWGWE